MRYLRRARLAPSRENADILRSFPRYEIRKRRDYIIRVAREKWGFACRRDISITLNKLKQPAETRIFGFRRSAGRYEIIIQIVSDTVCRCSGSKLYPGHGNGSCMRRANARKKIRRAAQGSAPAGDRSRLRPERSVCQIP